MQWASINVKLGSPNYLDLRGAVAGWGSMSEAEKMEWARRENEKEDMEAEPIDLRDEADRHYP